MYNFYIIDGKKLIDYKPKGLHYANAIVRFTENNQVADNLSGQEFYQMHQEQAIKYSYLMIKLLPLSFNSGTSYTKEELDDYFNEVCLIEDLLGYMTPRELMQMFPVMKTYDGEKYETVDYFYTIQRAEELGMDVPLEEELNGFLMDFHNNDIRKYMVAWMGIVGRKREAGGGKDIMVEIFEELGVKVHTMQKQGNFLVDTETNERFKINKPKNKLKKLFSVPNE